MYIYFSKNGSIKEIVNDEALRQGNNNTNVVYCYFEGTTLLSFSRVDFSILRNGDTSAITYTEDNDSPITAQVPYNADRKLLNFKYYTDYPFHKYTLTSTNLAVNGVIKITITAYDTNDKVFAMGLYIGQVENGVLNYDTDITEAQYQSLLNMLAQHARWTDIENYVGATREQVATKTNFMQYYNGVRVYDTLTLANADIANLPLLSVVLIKNENDSYDLYRKNDATTLVKVSSQDFINLYNASIKSITNTLVDGVLTTQLIKENDTTLSALIDLKNAFYLKSQVYTKQECDNLFLTIQAMSQYATKDYVNSTFATISALTDTNTLAQSAYDLASSKANTYVFDTYDLMKEDLASASATKYRVGDNLLIVALDTPDYWVKKVNATQSGDYGFYEVAEQEVNLQGYQKKTDNDLITTDKTIVGAINETLNIANSKPKEQQIDLTGVFSKPGVTEEHLDFSTTQTYELVNGRKYVLDMSYAGVYEDNIHNPHVFLHINGGTQYIKNPLYSRNARYKDIEQVKVSIATLYTMRWVFECFYYESENVGYFYIPTTISNQDIIKVSYFHENEDLTNYRIGQVIFDIAWGKFWVVNANDLAGTTKIAREITLPYLTSISVATESALGGIKAKALTNEQNTQEVLISGEKLYSQATPIATSTIAGSVKVADKTGSGSFVEVMIDSTGKLYCPTIPTLQFTIVSTLPTTGESNIIYLIPTTNSSTNNYDEYIWVNNKWELLGGVAIDLTNYYTKSEIDTKVRALNSKDIKSIALTNDISDNEMTISSRITLNDNTQLLPGSVIIPRATVTTAGLLTNTQNIKLNALPNADKVAQKFVINGTITNSAVAFNSLVVADLKSAINNNSVIIFKATNADIQDFIINTQKISGTTYTLIGNYTINNSGVITNYELTITIVSNVANGSISIVSGASVASADFSGSNTQLNGLTINGTNYKLLDVKVNDGLSLIIGKNRSLASGANYTIAIGDCGLSTASGDYSTALGSNSVATGNKSTALGSSSVASGIYSTALGSFSVATGSNSTALGYSSMAYGNASTAIGQSSKVYVPNWVSFDGETDSGVRTVSLKSTDNVFFRNENIDASKKTQESYTSGKTLTEVLNTKQDTLVSGTNIKTINGNSLLGSGNLTISGSGGSGGSVASADYASANTQLNGLTINGTNYKILDVKANDGLNLIIGTNRKLASGANKAVAIGACGSATESGSNSTVLGYSSRAYGNFSTAIGNSSVAGGNYSTAIGNESVVYVRNRVGFDGTSGDFVRTIALKSTDNVFFRNENVDETKTTQASYTDGKTLTQILDTKQDKSTFATTNLVFYNSDDTELATVKVYSK